MAWSGSGTFSRVFGASGWTNDKNNGVKILASRHDTNDQDLADGINACLTRNNETKPTADFLPAADNTLSLGSASFRWLNVNNIAFTDFARLSLANSFVGSSNGNRFHDFQNTSNGTAALSAIRVIGDATALDLGQTSSGFSGAAITGGPAGQSSFLANNGAFPLSIGTNFTERLRIDENGRIGGKALHNNATSPAGIAVQYIASGTYTPTITNVTNVTSSTARVCQWLRVGNVVTVSGSVNITETLGAAVTAFDVSLPLASNISGTAGSDLAGFCAGDLVTTGRGGPVVGNTALDRAAAKYLAQNAGATAEEVSFQFTYLMS